MKLIQTKANIKNGQFFLDSTDENLPQSGEVEVVIICRDNLEQTDFKETQIAMQKSFQEAGIETREQIIELIRDVKRELFAERHNENFIF
jgi:hypothetical protein